MSKCDKIEEMLGSALDSLQITLTNSGIDLILTHFALLVKWNQRFNLTALVEPKDIVDRLYMDSLLFTKSLPHDPGIVFDIGSGPGFPGIPMLARRPDIDLIIVEPRHKMASFLSELQFAIKNQVNFQFENRRSDDPVVIEKYSGRGAVAVSKAFASPSDAFPMVEPLLDKDGLYITCLNLETPLDVAFDAGFELIDEKRWLLPLTGKPTRHLIFKRKSRD